MTITDRDMRNQVALVLDASGPDLAGSIDVDAITDEIHATYGLIDIDEVPTEDFWAIVAHHDAGRG